MKRLAFVVALVFVAPACGALSPYAAVVNGQRISQRDVDRELGAIRSNTTYVASIESGRTHVLGTGKGTFDSAFVAKLLSRDIYFQLVAREVDRRHVSIGSDALASARSTTVDQVQGERVFESFPKWYRDKLVKRTAQVDALERAVAGPTPPDSQLRTYFDAHTSDFERVCASHILVDTREKADDIEARLAKGEDFAAIARTESKDPGSAPRGGDLGCFGHDAPIIPQFLNAAFTQPVGPPGPPVQTQFGFHIIKVSSKTPANFDDPQVQAALKAKVQSGGDDKLSNWLEQALGRAKVSVNPRFGRFVRTPPLPRVLPPQAPEGLPSSTPLPGPEPGGATTPSP